MYLELALLLVPPYSSSIIIRETTLFTISRRQSRTRIVTQTICQPDDMPLYTNGHQMIRHSGDSSRQSKLLNDL